MGLFNRKKKEAKAEKTEVKAEKAEAKTEAPKEGNAPGPAPKEPAEAPAQPYIEAAGFTIVSKSILNGTSKLKWLFRHDNGQGNGWVCLWGQRYPGICGQPGQYGSGGF